MKKNITEFLIFGIFAIVGIVMFVAGISWIVGSKEFNKGAIEITGKITMIDTYRDRDGDRDYSVYVDYKYKGQEYTGIPINEYNSSMYEGELITLLIDPDNPQKAKTLHGDLLGGIIMLAMGLIFGAVGIIPIIFGIKKSQKKKAILQQGRYIYAIVERVDINYGYRVNGRHPFVIYCNHQDEYSGVTYKFKSDNLWTDPYPYLQQGSQVRVFVNGQDYSQYHVDVEGSMQGIIVDYT